MQVSVETTAGLERRMSIEVPSDRIETEVQSRLRNLARTTRIKGFRPGKVPMKVLERQYGGQVRSEVLGEVMQSSFYEAVTKEQLRPAGAPQIEPQSLEPGKDLQFTATFEVFPEITLAPLDGVEFEKTVAEVTDADIDKMIETLRKQRASWSEVERAAQDGDRVTVDFTGTIDGEAFGGNEGKGVPVTIGGKRMIDGFEEGLVGAKAGDELTLNLAFPAEYGHKEVAGKPVQFAVTVQKVEEAALPEVDAEFVHAFGVESDSVDDLRQEIRQSMERELEQKVKASVKQQVMDKLLEINTIDVPAALVREEAESLAQQMRQNMHVPQGKSGVDLDSGMFEEEARRRVTLGLLLAELVQVNEIKVDPAQVREAVEKIAATYEQPEQVINWYYGDKGRLREVESVVLEDQVVDWVLGHGQVSEKTAGFDELMNLG